MAAVGRGAGDHDSILGGGIGSCEDGWKGLTMKRGGKRMERVRGKGRIPARWELAFAFLALLNGVERFDHFFGWAGG